MRFPAFQGLRPSDTIRIAVNHIRETAVFFYANVVAISVGILLVVVMLSMSAGLSRYVDSLMASEVSAELIEVTVDPHTSGAPPLTQDSIRSLGTIGGVAQVIPGVSSVFAELHSERHEAFISLASTTGTEDPEIKRNVWFRTKPSGPPASPPAGGTASGGPDSAGQNAAGPAGETPAVRKATGRIPAILIPQNVASELGVTSDRTVLLHITRSGGEALDIPVTIAAIARQTRFSRCYAPLPLMRRIRRWQDVPRATAAEVFAAPDADPAFVYDTALVYAHSVDAVPAIREVLEKRHYRTASILDSVKRYRQIMLIAGVVLTSLGLIALFTGSVSIFNAAYAAVLRRMRELAIYKTYGATRAAIMSIVLTESVITAIVSGILGFAAGGGVCLLLQHFVRAEVDFVLFPVESWLALVAFATACVASLAASILPALRAAQLSPTEAMRA